MIASLNAVRDGPLNVGEDTFSRVDNTPKM
jgi:hypothetical protein